jgi:hypothetical protein
MFWTKNILNTQHTIHNTLPVQTTHIGGRGKGLALTDAVSAEHNKVTIVITTFTHLRLEFAWQGNALKKLYLSLQHQQSGLEAVWVWLLFLLRCFANALKPSEYSLTRTSREGLRVSWGSFFVCSSIDIYVTFLTRWLVH